MSDIWWEIRNSIYSFGSKFKISGQTFLIFLAILVGLGGGIFAVFFRWLIGIFQEIFFGAGERILSPLGPYYVLIIPAVGGILVGLLTFFLAREAKGHGVPEVMNAVALEQGKIRPRVPIVKALVSAISIGSGGSVGREGPIVQIGSGLGSTLGQFFKLPPNMVKTLVGCGAAAGISATFNAPIAGVLFALEIILVDFQAVTFSLVVISSVTASALAQYFLGSQPAFEVPHYSLVHPVEFLYYVILGLLAAVVGLIFIKMLYGAEDFFEKIKVIPEWLKPMIGGFLIGLIGLYVPQIFGVGYETINLALAGKLGLTAIIFLVAAKLLSTSITLGSGGSGGVFAPSLFMGAGIGGIVGNIVHALYPTVTATSGAYALVGMGALVAAVTQAPITAVVIIFELTRDYRIILPLMIACVIAALVAAKICRGTIYTIKLLRRGVDISRAGKDVNIMKTLLVKDAMSKEVDSIPDNVVLRDVIKIMQQTSHTGFPVLSEEGDLVGIITLQDIRGIKPAEKRLDVPVRNVMTKKVVTVRPDETLNDVFPKFCFGDIGRLPVVSPGENSRLVGLITRSDIIRAYFKALEDKERE